jgi:hypothetical protein
MRYVLPALPVSGPSGKRVRRREAARLTQRQGAARRSGSCGRLLRRPGFLRDFNRAPCAACCARRSSAGRPKGGGGTRGPAKHVHWKWGRGPEGAEFLGCWQCGCEFKALAHRQSRVLSEQTAALAPVISRTTKQPSPALAHDECTRRSQRRRRLSNSEIRATGIADRRALRGRSGLPYAAAPGYPAAQGDNAPGVSSHSLTGLSNSVSTGA